MAPVQRTADYGLRTAVLYHFCRLQLPGLVLPTPAFDRHLERCFELYRAKRAKAGASAALAPYLERLYAVDWYLCCCCLEHLPRSWERLWAARANRADRLLTDALRARAVRLFPRDEERQETAVQDFWSYLIVSERPGSTPILARYDGQRPLVPWLIRVFQNKSISELRHSHGMQQLPEDDLGEYDIQLDADGDGRWNEEFRLAAREWLGGLNDKELLVLGLRGRCRMKQRDVAQLLGIHEGNISKLTTKLRDQCLEHVGTRLRELGWTGDDLGGFVLKEMESLLLDEPRLAIDRLAAMLAARGKALPQLAEAE